MLTRLLCEFLGTFWLVFIGCGSAILAAAFPQLGIGFAGVALAFGLAVVAGAYTLGPISGGHFNPAVSIGLLMSGRFPRALVPGYIGAQVLGAVAAGGVLFVIASGAPAFDSAAGFASNGYGVHSPGGYSLAAAAITEVLMTFTFLLVILGATDERAPAGFSGIVIGLTLTAIHLVSIPVTNTSVNPARSAATALFAGGWALSQLWMFWLMPIIGALAAGLLWRFALEGRVKPRVDKQWPVAS